MVMGDRVITVGMGTPILPPPPWWLRVTALRGMGGWGDRDKKTNKENRIYE